MDIIEKEIISEWADFYINYKLLQRIISSLKAINNRNNNNEENKENNDNINNSLNERLLSNNEQKEEEKKIQVINGINTENIFKKFISQLNLEIDKFSHFDNVLQTKRHLKRYNEIIDQLAYIENHPTMKMFKEQLGESLKNFYREISNYQLFIDTNIKIINISFNEIEEIQSLINHNDLTISNLQETKNNINNVLQSANEYNKKLLKDIEEQYTLYFQDVYRNENKTPVELLKNFLTPEKERAEKDNLRILHILILSMFTLAILIFHTNYQTFPNILKLLTINNIKFP